MGKYDDDNDADPKTVLLKNLARMQKKFIKTPDNNLLCNCLMAIVFARKDGILDEKYAEKLVVWISKWTEEDTPIPVEKTNDFDMFVSRAPLGGGRFCYMGLGFDNDKFNEVVPLDLRETILNQITTALNEDKKAESISLIKTQPTPIFSGDIPEILNIIDISEKRKERDK